ncbi:hypothetical protein scyTo_0007635 [Scyliorhinus torazame]|uniref:Uncharacterized protein n=1 Tax=Scyliorhinus torazame TaxID=75743 RepID=A0A401NW08_SCYTO|nr:hypothetical protein [Scyliorhinus torazame]
MGLRTSYNLVFQLKSIQARSRTFSVEQTDSTSGKPLDPSPDSFHVNTQGIIGGSIVGGLLLITFIVGITWILKANTKKIQISPRSAQDKMQLNAGNLNRVTQLGQS